MRNAPAVPIIVLVAAAFALSGCQLREGGRATVRTEREAASPRRHSMKGWELYSWRVGDEWRFALLVGTNRIKTSEEITTVGLTGIDGIKRALSRVAPGEYVFWEGSVWRRKVRKTGHEEIAPFALPPDELLNEIKAYCEQHRLKLHITN